MRALRASFLLIPSFGVAMAMGAGCSSSSALEGPNPSGPDGKVEDAATEVSPSPDGPSPDGVVKADSGSPANPGADSKPWVAADAQAPDTTAHADTDGVFDTSAATEVLADADTTQDSNTQPTPDGTNLADGTTPDSTVVPDAVDQPDGVTLLDGHSGPDSDASSTDTGSDGMSCLEGVLCTPNTPDPCGVFATECASGQQVCARIGNRPAGLSCGTGQVCLADGTCGGCVAAAACTPVGDPCHLGTLSCSTGVPSCQSTLVARPSGASCGVDQVCSAGVCSRCQANEVCHPNGNPCLAGRTSCATGTSTCIPTSPEPAGTSCGSAMVCNAIGGCVACQVDLSCVPTNNCHEGRTTCASGSSQCVDTGTALPDGTFCRVGGLCGAGECSPADGVLTTAEGNRLSTGGWAYTFANSTATVNPPVSDNVPFTGAPGGRTGRAFHITGTIPAQVPDVQYPLSGMGMVFTSGETLFNASRYGGIRFYAKSATPRILEVSLADRYTNPNFAICSTSTSSTITHRCFNYPVTTCNVGTDWTVCQFRWSDFARADWGNFGAGLPPDPSGLSFLQLNVSLTPAGALSRPFDFSIDDVALLPRL